MSGWVGGALVPVSSVSQRSLTDLSLSLLHFRVVVVCCRQWIFTGQIVMLIAEVSLMLQVPPPPLPSPQTTTTDTARQTDRQTGRPPIPP